MMPEDETTTAEERPRKTAVFIADNQSLYRQAICHALEGHMDIVGESALVANLWSQVEAHSPDIALLDIGPASARGFALAHEIATRCPGVAVVLLSSSPDESQLFQAIKAGAVAFVSKDTSADELVSTLRQVANGDCPINDILLTKPNTAKRVLQLFHDISLTDKEVEAFIAPLSRRETEILKYIAAGFSNKRIAYALGISEQTIKNHVTSILRKLNANARTEAVVVAIKQGLISID